MGLLPDDLEKVPEKFTVKDCYQKIYKWHKKFGKKRLQEIYKREDAYSKTYLALLEKLPPPEEVSSSCQDFIFAQVIYMLMEWSYHEKDENDIKMGAYAHFAANKRYNNIEAKELKESSKKCHLYDKFGQPEKWKNEYK